MTGIRQLRRRVRCIAEVVLALPGLAIIPLLPRPVILALARLLGFAGYRCSKKLRSIALANLECALGDSCSLGERVRLAKLSFVSFSLVLLDLFWFSFRQSERIRTYVRMDESAQKLIAGRNVILVTGHLGNWEVNGRALAQSGMSVTSVAAPIKNPFLDRILNRIRCSTGQHIVKRSGAMRHLIKALRSGRSVALVADQNTLPTEGGRFVKLFGKPAPMTKAPVMLAVRHRVPICFIACPCASNGVYTMTASEYVGPEELERESDGGMQRVADLVESYIRRFPETWLWMYKRWKYVPRDANGAAFPFYAKPFEDAEEQSLENAETNTQAEETGP